MDSTKIKEWINKRNKAYERRKKWALPLLILIFIFLAFIIFSKYSCTWYNDGTYENDQVFFYVGYWFKCIPISQFDQEYLNGSLKECLDQSSLNTNIYECRKNVVTYDPKDFKINLSEVN